MHPDWLRGMQLKKREKSPETRLTMKFKMVAYSAMENFSLFQQLVVHYQLKITC